ncbi:AtpZ/AtpI family protein [Rubinisphaera italica]|uniref:F0F1-ATPase subunit n=1 Tax=Rubinisphaera italica TaxID=2527969 RepID=A0A5C5XAF4_9PLAN|nr:AtpZ/AtpI family protein [Rubinisphaera italica]TWT59689.1 hypothetical protein Pan54_03980 [Rubinisphaera italica]
MTDKPKAIDNKKQTAFSREVGAKLTRKLKAQRHNNYGVWFGLGMMGLIGWSVVIPTLLGVVIGIWLDKHFGARHSWTLTLMIIGLTIGCWSAWQWVFKEDKAMRDEQEDRDE